jgi:hypothetical protein
MSTSVVSAPGCDPWSLLPYETNTVCVPEGSKGIVKVTAELVMGIGDVEGSGGEAH